MFIRELHLHLDSPPSSVFTHIALEFFTNHPRWDPDIVELTQLSPGGIGVGTEGREVRRVGPFRFTTRFRISAFEAPFSFAHDTIHGAMGEDVRYTIAPAGRGTDLRLELRIVPRVMPMRILAPLINVGVARNYRRNIVRFERLLRSLPPAAEGAA